MRGRAPCWLAGKLGDFPAWLQMRVNVQHDMKCCQHGMDSCSSRDRTDPTHPRSQASTVPTFFSLSAVAGQTAGQDGGESVTAFDGIAPMTNHVRWASRRVTGRSTR